MQCERGVKWREKYTCPKRLVNGGWEGGACGGMWIPRKALVLHISDFNMCPPFPNSRARHCLNHRRTVYDSCFTYIDLGFSFNSGALVRPKSRAGERSRQLAQINLKYKQHSLTNYDEDEEKGGTFKRYILYLYSQAETVIYLNCISYEFFFSDTECITLLASSICWSDGLLSFRHCK